MSLKRNGAQADALSLAYMLQQAEGLAMGRENIYALIFTDCEWNNSFPGSGLTGEEEVANALIEAYERCGDKLHITLVALDSTGKKLTNVTEVVDHVIQVSREEVSDYAAVAEKIARYTSEVIRQRSRGGR